MMGVARGHAAGGLQSARNGGGYPLLRPGPHGHARKGKLLLLLPLLLLLLLLLR
jgi:hypothetical protein